MKELLGGGQRFGASLGHRFSPLECMCHEALFGCHRVDEAPPESFISKPAITTGAINTVQP